MKTTGYPILADAVLEGLIHNASTITLCASFGVGWRNCRNGQQLQDCVNSACAIASRVWAQRRALGQTVRLFVGVDLVGVAQGEADLVPAVQETGLPEGVDVEGDGFSVGLGQGLFRQVHG